MVLVGLVCVPAAADEASRPIHLTVFVSKTCPHCALVEPEALARLSAEHDLRLVPSYFDIDDTAQYKRLIALERRLGERRSELPVVVVGGRLLGGPKEIQEHLADVLVSLRESGSPPVDLPTLEEAGAAFAATGPTAADQPPPAIHLAFFDQPGCRECARVERILNLLHIRYPGVVIRRFSAASRADRVVFEALCERAGVPATRRLLVPAVFAGTQALIQDEVDDDRLDLLCARYAAAGAPPIWEISDTERKAAERRLWAHSRTITLTAVIVGGLVDGVNPCAFATLVFLVCCLAALKRDRRATLVAGAGFTLGVFAAYLMVGVGLSETVRGLKGLPAVSRVLTWLIIAAMGILAVLSLRDAALAAGGRSCRMSLVIPARARLYVNALIARRLRGRSLALAALGLGVVVALIEFVCTGQVYLPVIWHMTGQVGTRLRGVVLLVVYCLTFVAPLVVVFTATFFGLSSQRLQSAFRRHVAAGKLALGAFFLTLGGLLLHVHLSASVR